MSRKRDFQKAQLLNRIDEDSLKKQITIVDGKLFVNKKQTAPKLLSEKVMWEREEKLLELSILETETRKKNVTNLTRIIRYPFNYYAEKKPLIDLTDSDEDVSSSFQNYDDDSTSSCGVRKVKQKLIAIEDRVATAEEIAEAKKLKFDSVHMVDRGDELGRGVFALRDIQPGETLASYGGRVMTDAEAFGSKYQMYLRKGFVINGLPNFSETDGHLGCYFNDAAGKIRQAKANNAKFVIHYIVLNGYRIPTVWIKAKKRIVKGAEVFVSYSPRYWRLNHHD